MALQLQQAQKMESSVLGFADLAMEDIDGTHPAREHVSELVKGARRGAELTQ